MSISEVTVKGTYKKADGSPETGTVKFRPALWQQSGSGIDAVLDSSGSFQTKFPSSDSGNWPDGLQIPYRVTVVVSSGTYVKELTFKSADSPIDLPTLFPIVSADSGGSGGSGGVPAAHAATHSPGASDPLPELAQMGNLLTSRAEAQCDIVGPSIAQPLTGSTVSASGGRLLWTATATSPRLNVLAGPGTSPSSGSVAVRPGDALTIQARARSALGGQMAVRLYWFNEAAANIGNVLSDWVPLTADWGRWQLTVVAPTGATRAGGQILATQLTVGQVVELDDIGIWLGAGGEWRPPGEPIPGLGFKTTKLGNAELLSVWQGGKWVPLSGDTGTFTVGNGTLRRVGNSVYLTATGYTPPTGFKPAQGSTAPTNVWYVTVDDWPTSVPGSAKLSNAQ